MLIKLIRVGEASLGFVGGCQATLGHIIYREIYVFINFVTEGTKESKYWPMNSGFRYIKYIDDIYINALADVINIVENYREVCISEGILETASSFVQGLLQLHIDELLGT